MSIRDWFRSAPESPRDTAAPQISVSFDASIFQPPMPSARPVQAARQYQAAQSSRLTSGWTAGTSSADVEIRSSLTNLRARSRQLCRDTPYAKRARVLVVNNVIGSGIGLQAQVKSSRSEMRKNVNDAIEDAWKRWCAAEFCHTGGSLHFSDFERALISEVFEAGEVFVRMHMTSFGGSDVPFALELIESERVPHEFQNIATADNARMGIEVDQYFRPIRYWVRDRHQSDIQPGGMPRDMVRPVAAAEMIHLRLVERWPQTRGVPWLHAVAGTLNNMAGYSEAEIVAARASAQPIGWEEPGDVPPPDAELQEDGTYETEYTPGFVHHGKKLNFYSPNRPNTAFSGFMSHMLKEIASGTGYGVRYSTLSGDYSQATYSSERASQLDDRDSWKALQQWFIRAFRARTYQMWLQQAVLSNAIPEISVSEYMANREKFEDVRFRPRGWGWVDPTKEVQAFKDAVRSGFMTLQDVIATSGADFEETIEQRRDEVAQIDAAGLVFDTDAKQVSNAGLTQARPVGTTLPLDQEEAVEIAKNRPSGNQPSADGVDNPDDEQDQQRMRVVK